MEYTKRKSNFNKCPTMQIEGCNGEAFEGYTAIATELCVTMPSRLVVDCYVGVNTQEVVQALHTATSFANIFHSEDIFFDGETLTDMMAAHLTDDRVRGVMYYGKLGDFVDPARLAQMRREIAKTEGPVLICGVGAALVMRGDVLVYADMPRWELQLRYRQGMPNFKQKNYEEDILKKYKRGYFVEWRVCDKHKRSLFAVADYWLDTTKPDAPKMISAKAFAQALSAAVSRPFRTVPYFDPGVWGGDWMEQVCGLAETEGKYAWCFDGVPEENSVLLGFGEILFEMPAYNIVQARPRQLLGERVYAQFGAEFPIRFDFLDTMNGQNLSLQVHPTLDFIRSEYGMPFTQEESYYILDAAEDACVYLGVQTGVDKEQMFAALEAANRGEASFPAGQYVNILPAKKHDHFLIPPGTIHCSGKNCMVLEISSSAYIFTFKLWDWDRLGLDGLPRPIHLEEGRQVLDFAYDTEYTKANLVNQFEVLQAEPDILIEKTGLHPLEYIASKRYTFSKPIHCNTNGTVQMLNLVEGDEVTVESPDGLFPPLQVHYAETFIVPARVGGYSLRPTGPSAGKKVAVVQAFVK